MKHLVSLALLASVFETVVARGADTPSSPEKQARIDPQLGKSLPLNLPFVDDNGEAVELGRYFGDKPVVLVLAYYLCPRLCTEVLNDLNKGLRGVPFTAGKDFQVVVVSFDAREKPSLAAAKKRSYVENYARPGAESGWHFLTGEQSSIDRLCEAVGFQAIYDKKNDQFIHESCIIVLTPKGTLSRYLFGLGYSPRDLRFALMESSEGKVGSMIEHIPLLCFHYDPATGKYSLAVLGFVRAGGILTMMALLGFWLVSGWRGRPTNAPALTG